MIKQEETPSKPSGKTFKSIDGFWVDNLEFGGIRAAVRALRLPFGKEVRSSVYHITHHQHSPNPDNLVHYKTEGKLDDKDIALLSTLVKRGDEHAKVLRGVVVWCEINAPRYWWQEMDTYRIGSERLASESTMHIQGKGLSTDELVEMKENLNEGTMQKRIQMFSYQTLRRIYFQRKDHRLPQWRMFCEWIRTLPFADELIICDE